jgi:methyl-accepting chemotaxis protein
MGNKKYNNPLSADLAMLAGRVHQAVNRINVIGDIGLVTETAEKMQDINQKVEEIDRMVSEIFASGRKGKK